MADGKLSVVATPIGNLEDFSPRARRILQEADVILAEDTRHTRKLCASQGIRTPLKAFHAHSDDARVVEWVAAMEHGQHVAIVSDAGTPIISDPGARLVAAAHEAGIRVEAIPGPSAVMAALATCGLRVGTFRFVGFVPRSGARRRALLQELTRSPDATVLFEAPTRLPGLLSDLVAHLGPDRPAAVCRELTKLYEETTRAPLGALQARYAEPPKGEVTVVVEGAPAVERALDRDALAERIADELAGGERVKDIATRLARELGVARRELYALALEVQERGVSEAD